MDMTPNFQLPIPGPDDYGATALYLETLARKADGQLAGQQDELNGFLKPLTHLIQAPSSDTVSFAFEYPFQSALWANDTTGSPAILFSNFPPAGSYGGNFPAPGWWSFGVSQISSNTTANSTNLSKGFAVILEAYSFNIVPGQETVLARIVRPYFETNTGGEMSQVMGTVFVPPGVEVFARVKMYHEYTVVRTVAAGSVSWRTYLGTGDATRKVTF